MRTIVLAATHERRVDARGREQPFPLLDLRGEPYLTVLVRKVAPLPGLTGVTVVTNEAIRPELEAWAAGLPPGSPPVEVLGDGTHTHEERLGAIGDLLIALRARPARESVLVIGGRNWFSFDLARFAVQSQDRTPAVVLTPLPAGVDASRFGVAETDAEGRVTRFVEKPGPDLRLPFRASCVYLLGADDLKWVETFAAEHPERATPGEFMEWLVGRVPVYGVSLESSWYDLTGTRPVPLRGPNLLEFREALRRAITPLNAPWERAAAAGLATVSSHEDLVEALYDPDPDRRIVAARLLGDTGHLLSPEGRAGVVRELTRLLTDTATNEYEYGGSQDDEAGAVSVAAVAAAALRKLGHPPGEGTNTTG